MIIPVPNSHDQESAMGCSFAWVCAAFASAVDPLTQTRAVAVRFSIQPSRLNSRPDPRQKLFRRFLSLQQSK